MAFRIPKWAPGWLAVALELAGFVHDAAEAASGTRTAAETPMLRRHRWSEYGPPPRSVTLATPRCMYCGVEQTPANADALCPKVSDGEPRATPLTKPTNKQGEN